MGLVRKDQKKLIESIFNSSSLDVKKKYPDCNQQKRIKFFMDISMRTGRKLIAKLGSSKINNAENKILLQGTIQSVLEYSDHHEESSSIDVDQITKEKMDILADLFVKAALQTTDEKDTEEQNEKEEQIKLLIKNNSKYNIIKLINDFIRSGTNITDTNIDFITNETMDTIPLLCNNNEKKIEHFSHVRTLIRVSFIASY